MHLITISKEILQTNYFSLLLNHCKFNTCITMVLHTKSVNTYGISNVYPVLKKYLPNIFKSKCFNDYNLPFSKEVRKTEIGHLFEHILLEYLCQAKTSFGFRNVQFSGVTNWNWTIDPYGVFHIDIDAGENDRFFLKEAIKRTIYLIELILRDEAILDNKNLSLSMPFSNFDNQYLYSVIQYYKDKETNNNYLSL